MRVNESECGNRSSSNSSNDLKEGPDAIIVEQDPSKNSQGCETKPKRGSRNTKIEYCQAKRTRGISFSKRKSGIMKKAEELSIITGSHVLLIIASETGRVYTYVTDRLQPVLKKCEYAIYECLNDNSSKYKLQQ